MEQTSQTEDPAASDPSKSQLLGEMLFELLIEQVRMIPAATSAKDASRIEGQLRAVATAARAGAHVRNLLAERDAAPRETTEEQEERWRRLREKMTECVRQAQAQFAGMRRERVMEIDLVETAEMEPRTQAQGDPPRSG